MIKISVTKSRAEIKGHAGYNKDGEDIVCAAISALFYALAAYLKESGLLLEYKAEAGDSFVSYKGENEGLKMFIAGCGLIAESYPENVSVVICNEANYGTKFCERVSRDSSLHSE